MWKKYKLTAAGAHKEDYSVVFCLGVAETEYFVGRDTELQVIHDMLHTDGSRRTVVLHGLGGIGKTQIAVAYAKNHYQHYSGIFWTNAKDEDALKRSFLQIGKRIARQHVLAGDLSSGEYPENLDSIVAAIRNWLSLPNNTRWLMIYDNYDNPDMLDIQKYLPESHQGCVIVTTRSSRVNLGQYISIKKLANLQDSLGILATCSRRETLRNGTFHPAYPNKWHVLMCCLLDPGSVKLAQKLDGLPLALATVGAYLRHTTLLCADYLRLYDTSWTKLQLTSPGLDSYEDRMLYSTWQLTFDSIKQQNELAAKLLQFWAYFHHEDVWFELVRHADAASPDWFRALTEDELSFNQAIRVLSEHGIVEPSMRE